MEFLKLLDELDKFRREHQDSKQYPADYCMRCMEAFVAKAAGYESRNDWTEKLKSDSATHYHKHILGDQECDTIPLF